MNFSPALYKFLKTLACNRKPTARDLYESATVDPMWYGGILCAVEAFALDFEFTTSCDPKSADCLTEKGWQYVWENSPPAYWLFKETEPTFAD